MANILDELQHYVADKLNADPQLSACPFIVENSKTVDYEIKQALGKQGVCGLVLTPKATYAGAYMDVGIAWQIDALEIDVVENVTVNRGKKNGYITGQDAAMRLFEVLCPLSGEHEGQFNPVSYEEGEDNSLLVNKSILKCLVHKTLIPAKTVVQFADGTSRTYDIKGPLELDWLGTGVYPEEVVDVQIGEEVTGLGERSFTGFGQLSSIVVPKNVTSISGEAFSYTGLRDVVIENGVTELGYGVFSHSNSLSSVSLPSTLQKIGSDVFEECRGLSSISVPKSVVDISQVAFRHSRLSAVTMEGRTKAETEAIDNYPWGLENGSVVHCTDGDIIVGQIEEQYTYAVLDGELLSALYEGAFTSEMFKAFAPSSYTNITDLSVGTGIDSLSAYCLQYGNKLSSVVLPGTITDIGAGAFYMSRGLKDVQMKEGISAIGQDCFFDCRALRVLEIPSTVQTIGSMPFKVTSDQYLPELSSITFKGKTLVQVQAMANYPWGIRDTSVIKAELPTISANCAVFTDGSTIEAESDTWSSSWQVDAFCELHGKSRSDIAEAYVCQSFVGYDVFSGMPALKKVMFSEDIQLMTYSTFNGNGALETVYFEGKDMQRVTMIAGYPFGLTDTSVISCQL